MPVPGLLWSAWTGSALFLMHVRRSPRQLEAHESSHGERGVQKAILIFAATLAAFLGAYGVSDDAEVRGRVVRVADGDTITILDAANTQHKIRFHGIDAPEKGQAFGKAAGKFLAGLVAGRDVVVKVENTDRYGRTVGAVFCDGRDINLEMLKAGYAWHYKQYDKSAAYAEAESAARAAHCGLWKDKNPINPHEFRKAERVGKGHE